MPKQYALKTPLFLMHNYHDTASESSESWCFYVTHNFPSGLHYNQVSSWDEDDLSTITSAPLTTNFSRAIFLCFILADDTVAANATLKFLLSISSCYVPNNYNVNVLS